MKCLPSFPLLFWNNQGNHLLWTKGKVVDNKHDMISSQYEIVSIDNVFYLTFEWKSGDYIFGKFKPGKYVLKKE